MSELERYRGREAKLALGRKLTWAVWVITVLVLLLVGMMRQIKIPLPEGVSFDMLPAVHAALNSGAALALVAALVAIKAGRVSLHRRCIYTALALSGVFLLSYVTYHFTTPETRFGDSNGDGLLQEGELAAAGASRLIYLLLLLSHIVLAALSLPFILLTFVYGFTNQPGRHRKMARWVFPVWLYVAITGPLCWWMLRPYY